MTRRSKWSSLASFVPAFVVALSLVVPSSAVRAQQRGGGRDDEVVSRVYDVRDLLVQVPDYPYDGPAAQPRKPAPPGVPPMMVVPGEMMGGMPGGQGGGGGPPAPARPATAGAEPTREELVEQIVMLIQETVAPETWRDAGGSVGSIRELAGLLIVTQSNAAHAMLANLLGQLRESRGQMIRLTAHWVLLPPGAEQRLLRRAATTGPSGPPSPVQPVDPDALAQLGGEVVRFRGQVICFNAQRVHIASGRGRTAVTDVEPVVGTNAAALDPTVETLQAGAVLQFRATLRPDANLAVLDLQSTVSQWDDGDDAAAAPAGGATTRPWVTASEQPAAAAPVDRVEAVAQQLRTTLEVPLNQPVLVGGMTLDPTTREPDGPQLYLIVEVASTP
jgi:hypothetical protein